MSKWSVACLPVLLLVLFFSCAGVRRNSQPDRVANLPVVQWKNDWTKGAVFYEVFVRSFQDSNGDGIGDLNGLISRLDYLNDGDPATTQDLGIDALWLMPVFESPSYHGYDVVNYKKIEQDYGTGENFHRLLEEAHKRGIRIIVDFVMNHTSSEHPWFVESASSPTSPKRNWYIWSPSDPGWKQPWPGGGPTWHFKNGYYYYGLFWSGMPDLNFRTPAVRRTMKDLAAFWLRRGVDGFRLDATRHLIETGPGEGQAGSPETHQYLKEFSYRVRRVKPQAVLVGENWTDTPQIAEYFGSTDQVIGGDELPMNFDFPLASAIMDGLRTSSAAPIISKIREIQSAYPSGVNDAPFLTNHDMVRLATQLDNRRPLLRSAASILLTLPGAPFLYYGEEVGILNGTTSGDESKRTPMPWDNGQGGGFTTAARTWFPFSPGRDSANVAAQTGDGASLLSHYRNLIRARKSSEALKSGSLELLTPEPGPVLAFLRTSPGERVLVAHNLSDSFLAAGPYTVTAISAESLYTDGSPGTPTADSGNWRIPLPPHSFGIWRMR